MSSSAVRHASSAEEAAGLLAGELAAGDAVLFKASRGIGLDRAVAALMAGA
jgi:UDP-N-acetylmuramyl pentapeptide synthase